MITIRPDAGPLPDAIDPAEAAVPEVTGLWIGESLPPLAELCIRSYLHHGARFRLYCYGSLEHVPEGTDLLDANEILPESDVFRHNTGSYAPASDWFRYRFLSRHGGIWTDLDMACLRPVRLDRRPWFAWEGGEIVAIGLLAFPPGHEVIRHMEQLAEDPATISPWDTPDHAEAKARLRGSIRDAAARRVAVPWGVAGPGEFTRALAHFGLLDHAAPSSSIYPVHYGYWRHAFDGTLNLQSTELADSFAIHLWGELLRREPDAMENLSPESIVAGLMGRHGISRQPQIIGSPPLSGPDQRILIGVCSARAHRERRQAVRDSWMSRTEERIDVCFFVGEGPQTIEEGSDIVVVHARDDYDHLPEKVLAFFSAALEREFDWLFKCDDDTYVDLSRIREVAYEGHDLIGNEFVENRGAPSGGAGYFLSRRLVESLVAGESLPRTGPEDVIVGDAARRLGAKCVGTRRLCWDNSRYPRPENNVITSHWCPPLRLHAIHEILHGSASEIEVNHRCWSDRLKLFPGGAFTRCSTDCGGNWVADSNGVIRLRWFSWPEETLIPQPMDASRPGAPPRYQCAATAVEFLTIELAGGMGNQMFQYAHGLALARETGATLRLAFADYGRPFALHHFGLTLDGYSPDTGEIIRHDGEFSEACEWPTLKGLRESTARSVRICGYFQNEGYFRPVADEIRRRFGLPSLLPDNCREGTPVCIHVRRGDFIRNGLHDVCRPGYYRDAIRIMKSLVAEPCFIVVSDDPTWCRENFGSEPCVKIVETQDEVEALRIMYSCKAFILSNSTFGWWAAWMSGERPVIAPNRFLAGRSWNICPDHWIQLPTDGA